jgi:hypothetical protein
MPSIVSNRSAYELGIHPVNYGRRFIGNYHDKSDRKSDLPIIVEYDVNPGEPARTVINLLQREVQFTKCRI